MGMLARRTYEASFLLIVIQDFFRVRLMYKWCFRDASDFHPHPETFIRNSIGILTLFSLSFMYGSGRSLANPLRKFVIDIVSACSWFWCSRHSVRLSSVKKSYVTGVVAALDPPRGWKCYFCWEVAAANSAWVDEETKINMGSMGQGNQLRVKDVIKSQILFWW